MSTATTNPTETNAPAQQNEAVQAGQTAPAATGAPTTTPPATEKKLDPLKPVVDHPDPVLNADQEKERTGILAMIAEVGGSGEFVRMPLDAIYVDRANNIREETSYTDADINEMKEQIKASGGVMSPVMVIPIKPTVENGSKEFGLIIGFRRSIATKQLQDEGFKFGDSMPVMIVKGLKSHAAIRVLQMLENVGRKELTPMEKARSLRQILDDKKSNFTQTQVGKMLGMHSSTVSKLLNFLHFPEEIQGAINEGRLDFHNADRLRRDIPESHWAATLDIAINKSQKEFDKYCDQIVAQYHPDRAKTEEGEGTAAAGSGDTQRAPTMLRSRQVETVYIPYLKELAGKADTTEKKWTDADILKARADALNTVLLKGDTELAKLIAPHLEEVKAKEAEEEAKAEATKKEDHFWKEQVRAAEELYKASNKPDPKNANKAPTTLAMTYVSVSNDILGKFFDAAGDDEAKKGEKAKLRSELGFELSNDKGALAQKLRDTHEKMQTEREENAKKRKEAQAKKEEEERAKAAAGEPHEVTTHPVTDPNAKA